MSDFSEKLYQVPCSHLFLWLWHCCLKFKASSYSAEAVAGFADSKKQRSIISCEFEMVEITGHVLSFLVFLWFETIFMSTRF